MFHGDFDDVQLVNSGVRHIMQVLRGEDADREAGAPGEAGEAADEPAATGQGHAAKGGGGREETGLGAANVSRIGRELTQADLASAQLAEEDVSSESPASSSFSSLSSLSE